MKDCWQLLDDELTIESLGDSKVVFNERFSDSFVLNSLDYLLYQAMMESLNCIASFDQLVQAVERELGDDAPPTVSDYVSNFLRQIEQIGIAIRV